MRSNSSRRPAGRATGAVIDIPRIANRAEIANGGTATIGIFVQIELAQKYCTGSFQPADDLCVLRGNAIFDYGARCGRAHPRGVDQIFQRDRYAMEWASPITLLDFFFSMTSLSKS